MCGQRLWLILLLTVAGTFSALAQGNSTYQFLRNDVGARAAALGGSFVTSTDDPNVIFYNPAGLATLSARRFSIGFFKHLMDVNSGYASFGTKIQNLGSVGVGIVYINYGEFQRTGEEGQNLGTFGAGEFALTTSYAGSLQSGLNYGASAKFISSSIADQNSTGLAMDLGMQYAAVGDRLLLGASLLNLGTQIDPYVNTRETLPLDFTIGASIYPEHLPAIVMVNFHRLNERQDKFFNRLKQFSVGAEFTASPNVQLRVGYNNQRRQDLKIGTSSGLSGFSIGGGINTDLYSVDYAFTSLGPIGAFHRISVAF
jgi:hypothetical protein